MPAGDDVTSLTASDVATAGQQGGSRIRYHALERGAGGTRRVAGGNEALEKLCRIYWRPI